MNQRDNPSTLKGVWNYFIRKRSPQILLAGTASTLAVRLFLGDFGATDLIVVAAITASWSFLEWLIHVFVLHFRPRVVWGRRIDPKVPRMHRAHHREPWNLEILFIPEHSFLYTLPILFLSAHALLAAPQAFTAIAWFFAMTLHYEWVHLLLHTRYRPKTRPYRWLWLNHRLHHFKNEHYWMGVTMTYADRFLRTQPDRHAVPTSESCRDLLRASK